MPTSFTTDKTYRIQRDNCQAIIIDVQAKLMPHVYRNKKILSKMEVLIQGLQALDVSMLLSEQYPKGLGDTVPELQSILAKDNIQSKLKRIEKSTFSVCDDADSWHYIAQQNRTAVIICGIETHVCVLQTTLDLLDNGMQPIVIADATGSRNAYDRRQAIRRMRRAGAVVTTTEAILFELCRSSKDPAFKTISALVK